jgi:hypothetical protein
MFRESRLAITDVQTRFLGPAVAVSHARWAMVGPKAFPGMPEPRRGIRTLVLARQIGPLADCWLSEHQQHPRARLLRPPCYGQRSALGDGAATWPRLYAIPLDPYLPWVQRVA